MTVLFETRDLTYYYKPNQPKPSLNGINIRIEDGIRTAILGANGAGKSTLFYHLNGILKPKAGEVLYRGRTLEYNREFMKELRNDVLVVVQNPDEQIFSATVEEDVAFGPLNMGLDRDEVDRRISESLDMVGMSEYRDRPTTQLSYGQRKRVAFAGALAVRPKVLILDEPTAGLDPQMAQEVLELVEQLRSNGTTPIISTHDVDLAYTWADEVHILRHGDCIHSGAPEPFFSDAGSVELAGLARPHVFSVNERMCAINGRDPAPYPVVNSELLAKMMPEGTPTGTIRLVVTDTDEPPVEDGCHVGIYGFRTRALFVRDSLKADFYFNGLEGCIMDAVMGRDVVLCCDRDLIPEVEERIERMRLSGVSLEAVR